MMVNGLMIKKVGLGKRHGRTELIIKVYTRMVKNMDRGNLFGTMEVNMMASFWITIFMEKGIMYGQMDVNTKETGKIIKCKGRVSSGK